MDENALKSLTEQVARFGDQQAFRRLFSYFYDYLFFFSNSYVKSKEEAEEIIQDVFVSLWKRRSTLTEITNLKVYLYVAVKNLSINYLKRSGFHYNNDLNQLDVPYAEPPATPEEILVTSEIRQEINKSIAELPPKCRLVYKLVKEDGLRYREVADILHISVRTVENHIGAALKKIAADIQIDLKTRSFRHGPLRQSK